MVIDRTYPLEEAAEAIRYLETGHVRGVVYYSKQQLAGELSERMAHVARKALQAAELRGARGRTLDHLEDAYIQEEANFRVLVARLPQELP